MWRWSFDLIDTATFKTAALGSAAASGAASWISSDWALAIFGIPFSVLIAGFAGALIAVAVLPPISRWWISLGAGTGVSAYSTSLVMLSLNKYTELGTADARGVAFGIGLIAYFLLSLFFRDGREIILGWLRSKLGIVKRSNDEII